MSGFESFPFNVGWEFTMACNLRCHHCASAAGLARSNELTTPEALRICDQFPALLVQEVDLTGGEPLLRKDWAVIAAHLKNLGISTNILTNGLNLKLETVRQMKDVGISNVGISLDGLERTHNNIRGRQDSYEHVLRSIDMIQKQDIEVIVITTVNDLNIRELPAMLNMLESMSVRNWRLQPLIPIGRVLDYQELKMSSLGILQLGDFIRAWAAQEDKRCTQIICSDGLEYIEGTEDPERPWRGCPAGWITCGITSDGKVKGCLSLPDELIEGDLRQQDLWSIWFDPAAFAYTRQFSPDRMGSNCKGCDKALECRGGCSSNTYAATGTFHNDPYCYYKINHAKTVLPDMLTATR